MSPTHSNEANWPTFLSGHGVGDVIVADVVSVLPFGAFVRVDGVDGFTPKSSWPALPEPGARVRARIEAIDTQQRRFAVAPA